MRAKRRRRYYFAMMGVCLGLFVMAWGVVRFFSVGAAIGMCVVAMVIPPVAAVFVNKRDPDDDWWNDPRWDDPNWDEPGHDRDRPDRERPDHDQRP
ncbi:hypothetical protein GCM10018790_72630 [Kitasatospora xanthocidica]|uniref:DUF3099 domain-containing protein n=1 Tax=Kitasatospora xanthocidica TaxID=83382 RepID=UPI00167A6C25|nr:DUF3099 domain-containing protein [Kitasatospora xanthocidica]GHF84500.1 hypothetical protein GCM10018790_72630 [Kitasatospora xanthocidica]